jgi:hypothetical protein
MLFVGQGHRPKSRSFVPIRNTAKKAQKCVTDADFKITVLLSRDVYSGSRIQGLKSIGLQMRIRNKEFKCF